MGSGNNRESIAEMNLVAFLKKVDEAVNTKNHEQLSEFIHEIARTYPEESREAFLCKLDVFTDAATDESDSMKKPDSGLAQDHLHDILEKMDEIDTGQRILEEEYNDEYDDWYNTDVEEILYRDTNQICEIIISAAETAHRFFDIEDYENAESIYRRLLLLDIQTDGQYTGETLSISDLEQMGMVCVDMKAFAVEAIVSAYFVNPKGERPEAIYELMNLLQDHAPTLENMLQGSLVELPETGEFISAFIDYLGDKEGRLAEKLILEAVSLENDREKALTAARLYAAVHPCLYKRILYENGSGQDTHKFCGIGLDALKNIPESYIIRSEIALKTADYALEIGDEEGAHSCWTEAFRSDTTAVNYLRICLENPNYQELRKTLRKIYRSFMGKDQPCYHSYDKAETAKNSPDRNMTAALLFFDGQFEECIRTAMNSQASLGWSATFMKQGMALFLLYLHEGNDYQAGCRNMCQRAVNAISFTSEKYSKGLNRKEDIEDTVLFSECFTGWKSVMPMEEYLQKELIGKISIWIRKRVEGIMNGNHRNYYGECAAFIAAFGEVLESRGEAGAKARCLEEVRAMYSRRRAFHEELRHFGMKAVRK